MSRKVKDAMQNGERIYFRGHAGATYMSDGNTVEKAMENVSGSIPKKVSSLPNDAGYATVEDVYRISKDLVGTVDLSKRDIHGNPTDQTTANCYVVKEPGVYKFPVAYGAAIKDGTVNTAAYTKVDSGEYTMHFVNYKDEVITSPYIETDTGSVASSVEISMMDTEGAIDNLYLISGGVCRYILFEVKEVPATGANGVISVLDSEGVVMWSWHIWVWPDDLTPVTITNKTGVDYNILPVNLASKWQTDSSNPTQMTNWYYQWGRPTPMLPAESYNSTSNSANYGVKTFGVSSGKADTYGVGIRNPQIFYKSLSQPFVWFGATSYYNLWDAGNASTGTSDNTVVKTVYDPCPPGFAMPNGNTFTYFSTSNVVGSFNNGWYFKRNAEDITGVFFPASDRRHYSYGLITNTGYSGYVWLSSSGGVGNAWHLLFKSSSVTPRNIFECANGCSVRPVQE